VVIPEDPWNPPRRLITSELVAPDLIAVPVSRPKILQHGMTAVALWQDVIRARRPRIIAACQPLQDYPAVWADANRHLALPLVSPHDEQELVVHACCHAASAHVLIVPLTSHFPLYFSG
jgi:hypothetical protein